MTFPCCEHCAEDEHFDVPMDEHIVPCTTCNLGAEVVRLRARIHEAVDECQRRFAPMQSEHDRLVALHREVVRRHGEDQIAKGEHPDCGISTYGVAITAVIAQERDAARATIALLDEDVAGWISRAVDAEATIERVRALCGTDYIQDVTLASVRAALDADTAATGTGQEGTENERSDT